MFRSIAGSALVLSFAAPSAAAPVMEPVIANSFASRASLAAAWIDGYPWGRDHNGSARMDPAQVDLADGVLTIRADRIDGQGLSSEPPHLPIRYRAAALHSRQKVLIDDRHPLWVVSGDFQAPVARGTWPAFWLTAVDGWPPESDILEFKGDARNWFNTFRTPTDVDSKLVAIPDADNTWHRYAARIEKVTASEVTIDYYLDGIWRSRDRADFVGKPMHVIINLQMEGSSDVPGPNKSTYYRARNVRVERSSSELAR